MAIRAMVYTAATALTITGLSSLGNAATAVGTIDNTTNKYLDYLVEFNIGVGVVSGNNKQYRVFAQSYVDGTNHGDETLLGNLVELGVPVICTTPSVSMRSRAYSVAAGFDGRLPPKVDILVYNDTGVAFTSGTAQLVGVYESII